MLIAVQVSVRTEPMLLSRILGPRIIHVLSESIEDLQPKFAQKILKTLSRHLESIGIQHRITIYETLDAPNIIFLRPQDPFPPALISSLVSLLVTQDFVPPLTPPEPFQDYLYEFL